MRTRGQDTLIRWRPRSERAPPSTHYFAATLADPFSAELPKVVDASYNLGASWVPLDEALGALAVNPPIAAAVARVLRRG